MWNALALSETEGPLNESMRGTESYRDTSRGNISFLPIKKSGGVYSQTPMNLPAVITGTVPSDSGKEHVSGSDIALEETFSREIEIRVEDVRTTQ